MDKVITPIMANKKKRTIWVSASIGFTVIITILVLMLPYMQDANGLTIQLIDLSTMQAAYVIWIAIFTTIFYFILYLYPKRDTIPDLSISQAIFRILPVPPLTGAWLVTLLPLFGTQDQAHYFSLGSKFMIANYMEFTGAASVDDIVQVGQGLTYGIGFYLLLSYLILATIHYIILVIWSVRPDTNHILSMEESK